MIDINTLYDRLSSIRLTIFLCILLAVVSVLGTLIPQNLADDRYTEQYGPGVGGIVTGLGLDDLYHSAGFVVLLCLLASNLVACTAKRLPGTWRSIRREPPRPVEKGFEGWKCKETFACSGPPGEIEGQLEGIVKKALGRRAREVAAAPKGRAFLVEKNRYARLGPYLAHASILLILLGALWGAFQGFKGVLQLAEGEASSEAWLRKGASRVPLGFEIRCDRFLVDHYPDGTPKDYRSEVSLFDSSGEQVRKADIRVNHPVSYGGVTFYQSTYGSYPELELEISDPEDGEVSLVKTRLNAPFLLPGGHGDRAMVIAFQEDLQIPEEMARITRLSRRSLGPAARLVVFNEKGFGEPFWAFRDLPKMGQRKETPYHVVLKDYRLITYTGLQVVKDPGTPLVWIGCTLLVIGFLMALLMDQEIVWVIGERSDDDRYRVRMVGRAARHPGVYTARFDRQKLRLRRGLSPWLKP